MKNAAFTVYGKKTWRNHWAAYHEIHTQWIPADALYGSTYEFRKYLLDKKQAYVVAISRQQHISINFQQTHVDEAVENFPPTHETSYPQDPEQEANIDMNGQP